MHYWSLWAHADMPHQIGMTARVTVDPMLVGHCCSWWCQRGTVSWEESRTQKRIGSWIQLHGLVYQHSLEQWVAQMDELLVLEPASSIDTLAAAAQQAAAAAAAADGGGDCTVAAPWVG